MIRVMIADDEPLARRKLRDLISDVAWVECVGETGDGPSTIEMIDEMTPGLLFLDIRMPGASGLKVLERVTHKPHVIFTTAFDQYAVTAFELQALDYLLKPFGPERFRKALARAQEVLEHRDEEVPSSLQRSQGALSEDGAITRLFVRERGKILPLSVQDIEHLEACDDYVALHVASRRHLVQVRLNEFETRLDQRKFIRVHRSHIVNLDFVTALVPYDGARFQVELRDGTIIIASRARSKELRQLVV